MKKWQFRLSLILIWVSLIVNAIFSYEQFNRYQGVCWSWSDYTIFDLDCHVNAAISITADVIFWGVLATVLIVSVAKIDNDDDEEE